MDITPFLKNLTDKQFESLLGICIEVDMPAFTVVFEEGDPSRDMYILTEGHLRVVFGGGTVGEIDAINTVGEMGMITGEPRSTKVITSTKCRLLKILKTELFALFENDKDFHIKFQNIILLDLVHKLTLTNETISRQNRYILKIERSGNGFQPS